MGKANMRPSTRGMGVKRLVLLALLLGTGLVEARNIRRFPRRRALDSELAVGELASLNGVSPVQNIFNSSGGNVRPKDLECRLVHKKKYRDKCQFIKDNCADEEVGMFDYLRLYYCKLPNSPFLAISILGGWLAMLFMTIGIAASDFFCPNLATISKILGMSESVAGVTFLALGNGSPDVFSTFAAMKINSASLAIGELIGAASFITAVVAGSMAIVKPFKVSRRSFIRDVSFFILAIVSGVIFLRDGTIGLGEGILMISFYVFYVLFVIGSQWYYAQKRRKWHAEQAARAHYGDTDGESPAVDDDYEEGGGDDGVTEANFNLLENGQTDDYDEYEDEELQEQQKYAQVTRNLSKQVPGRPRMERQYTGAIRPSLATAMEFRAVIHSLAKSKNQLGGPFQLARVDEREASAPALRRHASAPHAYLERRVTDPAHQEIVDQDHTDVANGRLRAVSVNDAAQPRLEFGEFQSSLAPIQDATPPNGSNMPAPPEFHIDLASPTGTQPKPQVQDNKLMHPTPQRILTENEDPFFLSPPSSRGVSPSPSSKNVSPTTSRPVSSSGPTLQIPGAESYVTRSPSPLSMEASVLRQVDPTPISDINDRPRRDSSATFISQLDATKRTIYQWWPYNFLPAPQEISETLFPTMCGFTRKSVMEQIFAIITTPSILLLTLTLPVYEIARDVPEPEEITSVLPAVTIESPTSSTASYLGVQGDGASEESSAIPNTWCRWLAGIQCILAPLFVVSMVFCEEGALLKPILWGLVSGLVGLAILLTTTTAAHPPKFRYIFCFIGFLVGITWISTIANEVVGVLKAFGVIFGISDAILGLTVFAVGNSLGDLVANITIAKLGFPVMALAACFGGPLLNILLGIGGSGLFLTVANPKKPLQFEVTPTLMVSGGTLLLTLLMLLVMVPLNKWRMSRRVGIMLIGLWVASTSVNLTFELMGKSRSSSL